ncbi:MAG: hypothetical protein D8M58_18135 [Calditrichaeota bacterium]|nr:MAG: hypothetical protein DWQ03_11365 [Calditrichota bacterium]MBL1207329.1 hypothetical protein [Calditrichota bacterium]NOG47162.1 hypothetical protein [Calditrichota bacterium]
MGYTFFDFIGNLGVLLIISTYLLLQLGKIKSSSLSYSGLNALGAAFIIISLLLRFNLSAFIVELFWLIISLFGIIRYFKSKQLN